MSALNKISLLLPLLLLLSCEEEVKEIPLVRRPVITYTVPDLSGDTQRRFSGETEAHKSVDLGFELAGRIISITAESGKKYKKGEILAQLDPNVVKADLELAEAQALQSVQQLRRTQELVESGNASQADFDAAIANQKASEAQLKSAKLALGYTTLKMPYDGVIANIPVDVNAVVAAGTPVMSIQGEGGMDFTVGVPSVLISKVQENQQVEILLSDLGKEALKGRVTEISPTISVNTTYPVTIAINDPDKIPNLRSGLDGEAVFTFQNAEQEGVSIPLSAVQASTDQGHFVWVLTSPETAESELTRKQVSIGELSGEGMIRILSGLKTGEVIVAKGLESLTEGLIVKVPKL